MKELSNKNGITLIALVLTIIVLLILAGVSIAMLTGENGILSQAENAKERNQEGEEKERIQLAINEAQLGNNGYQKLTEENLQKEIDEQFGEEVVRVYANERNAFSFIFQDKETNYRLEKDGKLNKIDIALKINNKEELRNFMNEVNNGNTFEKQYVYLMENIDLAGETWDVIGSYTDTTNKAFAGIFEGNNRTINGLNINKNQDFVGLFVYNTGIIRDIILESGTVTGVGRVGGIVAVNSGLIENCHNKGVTINLTGNSTGGGGICARSTGEITYCSNSSNITAHTTSYVGGIVGALNYTKIKNCYNLGNIEGISVVGGVIGNSTDSEIQFCYNTGDITGTGINSDNGTYVGGIIGSFHKNIMRECYNSGKIKCEYINAGGIAGENYGGNIKSCYNIGIILKCSNYGNICGAVYKEATIENCYFSKDVTDIDGVGYTNVETKQETINKDLNYMKTNSFVNDLNKEEEAFTINSNLNNGYPVLKWQCE